MRFSFSEDQLLFRESFAEFLAKECGPALVTSLWSTETGRSPALWSQLAELGVLGALAPERFGGLGLSEIDFVLLLEEAGRVALPEPVLETAGIAVPLLRELGDDARAEKWLTGAAAGETIAAVGHPDTLFVADAHVADLLLLPRDGELHALPRSEATLVHQPTSDGSTRLFRVDWTPGAATRIAGGDDAERLLAAAFDRGALGCAALLLGTTRQLVERTVAYASEREQFGVPIGSFQAVKHQLASVQVALEFARPAVYRAAWSVANDVPERALHVSEAKHMAASAALRGARTALQVHGAIGYTWEQDVHVWMKRAWSLADAWGSDAFHRRRIAAAIVDADYPTGPGGPGVRQGLDE